MDLELEALRDVHTSFANATRFSDKPELYRPLMEGMGRVCQWLEHMSEDRRMLQASDFAAKEMVLEGHQV